ncbi:MAG: glutaredoxin family protein [Nitrospinota bacterium]|nr:glutaredoxin family protein [Nitrospinota bacterium]
MSEIILYSTAWCSDCHAAKRVLDEKGISYKEIDIDENQDVIPIIVAARGKKVVPTLEYKGAFMDGNHFDLIRFETELKDLLNR